MKVKKNHMIFLLVLIGIVCIAGGNVTEGMSEGEYIQDLRRDTIQEFRRNHSKSGGSIGGNPSTWGPPLHREVQNVIGGNPNTWGPPIRRHHSRHSGKETGSEQMMKIFFIGFLLLFIVFLLF